MISAGIWAALRSHSCIRAGFNLAFSAPYLRLHSTNNPFHERRPWGWDAETERVSSAALRLRHQLIPYIYSMAWRNHTESMPLIRPMYHEFAADDEQAYHCPDQYTFGSELIAAPFLEPLDEAYQVKPPGGLAASR